MYIQQPLKNLVGADNLDHAMNQAFRWHELLLLAVIVAPILEELIFRFFLKYERNYLLRFISHILPIQLQGFWRNSLRFWVYVSAFLFGIVHYLNFSGDVKYLVPAMIILTLPQIILGFILAFVRLKMGFFWAVSFHAVWNGIIMGLTVLFLHGGISSSNETDLYSIDIEKHFFLQEQKKEVTVKKDIDGNILSIEANNQSINSLFESVFEQSAELEKSDYWNTLNLSFTSEGGVPPEEAKEILIREIENKTNAFY